MPDNRDFISQAFAPYGAENQSRATPAQLATAKFNPASLPTQVVDDPTFQVASARQPVPSTPTHAPSKTGTMPIAYQQAMDVSGGGALPVMPETTIQQTEYNPRLMQQQQEQIALEQDAARRQAEAQQAQAAIQSQGYAKLANDVEARMKEFQSAADEFKNAKIVDPRSEWGAAQKIGAALAMGLGAYAAAFSGGKNYAADIIESTIKRDLDMQEARINKLGVNAKNAEGALAQAYRKFGDMAQARSAVEMAAIAQLGEQARKQALASDSDNVKANADKLIAALEAKKFGVAAEAQKRVVSTTGKPMATSGAAMNARLEKESNEALEFENAKNAILTAFDVGQKQGFAGAIPSMIGGKSGEYGANIAQVSGAIIGKVPGIKSDSDFKNIVMPMLPKPTDPQRTIEEKRQNMIRFLQSQAPAGWLKAQGKKDDVSQRNSQLGFSK